MNKTGRGGSEAMTVNTLARVMLAGIAQNVPSPEYLKALLIVRDFKGLAGKIRARIEEALENGREVVADRLDDAELKKFRMAAPEDEYGRKTEENILADIRGDRSMAERLAEVVLHPPKGLPRATSLIEAVQYLGKDGLPILVNAEDGVDSDVLGRGAKPGYFKRSKGGMLMNLIGEEDATNFVNWITRRQIGELKEVQTFGWEKIIRIKTSFPTVEQLQRYWKIFHPNEKLPAVLTLDDVDLASWGVLLANYSVSAFRANMIKFMEEMVEPSEVLSYIKKGENGRGQCSGIATAAKRLIILYEKYVAMREAGIKKRLRVKEMMAFGKKSPPKGIKIPSPDRPIEPPEGGPARGERPASETELAEAGKREWVKKSPIYGVLSSYTSRLDHIKPGVAVEILRTLKRLILAYKENGRMSRTQFLNYLAGLGVDEGDAANALDRLVELSRLEPPDSMELEIMRVTKVTFRKLNDGEKKQLAFWRNELPRTACVASRQMLNLAIQRITVAWQTGRPADALMTEIEGIIQREKDIQDMNR